MERNRTWHPFRPQGFCGMVKTTCFLTVLSTIITIIILASTQPAARTNTNSTDVLPPNQRDTARPRQKRSPASCTENPMRVLVERGMETSFICDPIAVAMGEGRNTAKVRRAWGEDLYFCRHPCGWSDVKAYSPNKNDGKDGRFKASIVEVSAQYPLKGGSSMEKRNLLKVTAKNLTEQDEGVYYCAWGTTGKDSYQRVLLRVVKRVPPWIKEVLSEEEVWLTEEMQNEGNPEVKRAMLMCEGNKACALALLQKQELEINESCWWCLQMSHAWKVAPLKIESVKELEGNIPCQIIKVMQTASSLSRNRIPTTYNSPTCDIISTAYEKPKFVTPPVRVVPEVGDVCLCSVQPTKRMLGWSDCKVKITMRNAIINCTATVNNVVHNFTCPFDRPNDTLPAVVWVCGDRAFHHLPSETWTGCCYPALLSVGTTVYFEENSEDGLKRRKRSTLIPDEMPSFYKGTKLWDPWTSREAETGWSLLIGGGTAATLLKMNGLAWQVLALANGTEKALDLMNDEMSRIRDAVSQNRLVLDMLTAEKGGVCKMLGTSCCFYIPDYKNNVTDIIVHMRKAVKEPKEMSNSWLNTSWGGWKYWLVSTLIPVMFVILLILVCAPCVIQCFSGMMQRIVHSNVSMQMIRMNENDIDGEVDDDDDDDDSEQE